MDDINRTIFLGFLIWLAICFCAYAYTPLGEGWRHTRNSRLVFTLPPLQRIVGLTLALVGPSGLLIGQSNGMIGSAALLSLLFLPGLVVGVGIQEFSADLSSKTYYTKRGILCFAPKKTGRLDQLKGVQMREVPGLRCFIYVMRPEDKEKGGFQIGDFLSRDRAVAAAEQASIDLHIPLLPPKTFQRVSGV